MAEWAGEMSEKLALFPVGQQKPFQFTSLIDLRRSDNSNLDISL